LCTVGIGGTILTAVLTVAVAAVALTVVDVRAALRLAIGYSFLRAIGGSSIPTTTGWTARSWQYAIAAAITPSTT
jgi:hypothetical protein